MSIELQNLDCNCNNCKHMVRDFVARQESVDLHYGWQKDTFNIKRIKLLKAAKKHEDNSKPEKAKLLVKEARKMKFQFDEKGCAISYGDCKKFEKKVSFIPNILQLDTQECFENRKE